RLGYHLVSEREDRGHHDRGPRRALQRDQAGIVDDEAGKFHPLRSSSGAAMLPSLPSAPPPGAGADGAPDSADRIPARGRGHGAIQSARRYPAHPWPPPHMGLISPGAHGYAAVWAATDDR